MCLTQAPNTAMQICRNKGATKKASRKTVFDKVFKVLAKKGTFIKKCSDRDGQTKVWAIFHFY